MQILKSENDFYTSVYKALKEIDPRFEDYNGLIITGSHSPMHVEDNLKKIRWARENKIPTLGICMGMQLMAIEFARWDAGDENKYNSTEIDPNAEFPIVIKMPELRVGIRPVNWGGQTRMESHWHNYKINREFLSIFREDWVVTETDEVVEVMRMKGHPFFCGIQFHPEYQSSKNNPHPLLKEFIKACKQN